jgi:phage shock protein A
MNVWSKIVTALRGGVNELGESVVDTQAMRILDQEIRDSDEELRQSKKALAEIMAKEKVAEKEIAAMQVKISEYEVYALQALEKDEQSLALEVAEKIADVEVRLKSQVAIAKGYGESVVKLRRAVKQAEGSIKRLRQQADTVKATESVQRAQAAVANRYSGGNAKLQTAMDSLERIKQKQNEKDARMEAEEELWKEGRDTELDDRLKAAGIKSSDIDATAVLERLKKK